MLDIELIRSDPAYVRAALLKRVDNVDLVPILEADALRRKLTTEVDEARSAPNRQAKEIGKLKASGVDTAEAQKRAAVLGDQVIAMQAALTEADKTLNDLLMELPNLPDDRSPVGGKEANQVVHTGGDSPTSGTNHSTTWS
jgi:seryl-tRNA synthetase